MDISQSYCPNKKWALFLISLFVSFLANIAFADYDEIIDNDSPDFIMNGSWSSSTLVPGYYGNNYRWTYGGGGEASAEWVFQIPSDGSYQVLTWWSTPYETRSSDAPYTIYHANGSTTVDVDQRINGSQWNDLGTYYFSPGEARFVLTNDATGNPVADAVRIIYVGGSEGLVASFTASPLSGPGPLEVHFTDQSIGEPETWFWDFGDGETSTEQNPWHVFQGPGLYAVNLTVTSAGEESTESKADYITVVNGDDTAYEFIWPIEEQDFFVFQAFGNQRMEIGEAYHSATDFGVYRFDVGVRSIANGWVEHIDSGFGNSIMIRHLLPDGETVYSWYNHMAYSVAGQFSIGQFIPVGTVIGIVGETGWTPSGLHIHLEIKKNSDDVGGYIYDLSDHYNPYEFILSRLSYNPSPPDECSDGTSIDECSVESPFHCIEGGFLVENSLVCGCESGVPQADATCSKTEEGIIVDNDDPGFQSTGYWQLTTLVMGFYGSDYLIAYADDANSTASWTPNIPDTGYYRVYGWWRARFSAESSDRATNASIIINHAGEQAQVTVDFSDYYKGWKYLGTFMFEEGTNNSVVLTSTSDGDVIADAFRFVWDSPSILSADFAGSPAAGSAPLTVQFNDTSTGDVSSWLWEFGDSHSSVEQNPFHIYENPGTYNVTLTIDGPTGTDTETKIEYITVFEPDQFIELTNSIPVTGQVIPDQELHYQISVPSGQELLEVMLTGTNDADLYVRYGEVPNVNEYHCRPYTATSNEICSFPYPAEGEWFITVRGYSGSADYELVASFSDSSLITLSNGVPVTGTVAPDHNVYYKMDVPPTQTFLEFEMTGTGGDADIYVKYGSVPTLTDFDCRPYTITSNEICTFNSPDPGKWFIMINGYEETVDYELTATHY